MNLPNQFKSVRKLPRTRRRQFHMIVIWVIIPFVLVVWGMSLASTLRQASHPEQSPEPVLGQQIIRVVSLFANRVGVGFQQFFGAASETVRSWHVPELFYRWWRSVWGKPVVSPIEPVTPVPLPVVSPSAL